MTVIYSILRYLAGVFLLAIFIVPAIADDITPSQAGTDKPSIQALVSFFDEVVFGNKTKQNGHSTTLARWSRPIYYAVQGHPSRQNIADLKEHIYYISNMLELEFAISDELSAEQNLTFLFLAPQDMSRVSFSDVDPERIRALANLQSCYFLFSRDSENSISRSVIVINKDRDTSDTKHCLLEELVQSLGMPNDTDILRPSIFSQADRLTKLSRNDEIILRTLYDARLFTGQNRSDALPLVEKIISELNNHLPQQ